MSLKLSQALDLAIGVDNASVNLLHLREVLVTVITTLEIGQVTVKDYGDEIIETVGEENERNEDDFNHTLPEDETKNNTSGDRGLFPAVVRVCMLQHWLHSHRTKLKIVPGHL